MRISFELPKPSRKNLFIAGGIVIASIAGGITWKNYSWKQYVKACDDAREVRRDATRLMTKTIFDGYDTSDIGMRAGDLLESSSEIIRECDSRDAF